MSTVDQLGLAIAFCAITMVGWGSWANTQKLAGSRAKTSGPSRCITGITPSFIVLMFVGYASALIGLATV